MEQGKRWWLVMYRKVYPNGARLLMSTCYASNSDEPRLRTRGLRRSQILSGRGLESDAASPLL